MACKRFLTISKVNKRRLGTYTDVESRRALASQRNQAFFITEAGTTYSPENLLTCTNYSTGKFASCDESVIQVFQASLSRSYDGSIHFLNSILFSFSVCTNNSYIVHNGQGIDHYCGDRYQQYNINSLECIVY